MVELLRGLIASIIALRHRVLSTEHTIAVIVPYNNVVKELNQALLDSPAPGVKHEYKAMRDSHSELCSGDPYRVLRAITERPWIIQGFVKVCTAISSTGAQFLEVVYYKPAMTAFTEAFPANIVATTRCVARLWIVCNPARCRGLLSILAIYVAKLNNIHRVLIDGTPEQVLERLIAAIRHAVAQASPILRGINAFADDPQWILPSSSAACPAAASRQADAPAMDESSSVTAGSTVSAKRHRAASHDSRSGDHDDPEGRADRREERRAALRPRGDERAAACSASVLPPPPVLAEPSLAERPLILYRFHYKAARRITGADGTAPPRHFSHLPTAVRLSWGSTSGESHLLFLARLGCTQNDLPDYFPQCLKINSKCAVFFEANTKLHVLSLSVVAVNCPLARQKVAMLALCVADRGKAEAMKLRSLFGTSVGTLVAFHFIHSSSGESLLDQGSLDKWIAREPAARITGPGDIFTWRLSVPPPRLIAEQMGAAPRVELLVPQPIHAAVLQAARGIVPGSPEATRFAAAVSPQILAAISRDYKWNTASSFKLVAKLPASLVYGDCSTRTRISMQHDDLAARRCRPADSIPSAASEPAFEIDEDLLAAERALIECED